MKFQEGHKKLGGRKKGSKNKKTLLLDSFAQTIIEDGMQRFQKQLSKLKGKQYVNAYLALLEYVKPKLQRSSITMELDRLSDEQVDEIYRKIISNLNNQNNEQGAEA